MTPRGREGSPFRTGVLLVTGERDINQTYQRIFESSGAGILLIEWQELTIVDLNRSACMFLGRKPEELIGRVFLSYTRHPEAVEKQIRGLEQRSTTIVSTAELIPPHGSSIPVLLSIAPLIEGSIFSCTFLPLNNRENKRVEALSELLTLTPDPMFVMDRDARFTHFFWRRTRDYGIDPASLIGGTVYNLYPEGIAKKEMARYREVFSTRRPLLYQSRVHIKGEDLIFSTHLLPLLDSRGEVTELLGVSHDITEQEREKKAATQLEREMDYRKDFVMTAAHELRTPLQPILGYLHLILDDPAAFSLTPETQRMLCICLENVERERHIVDRMLELSLLYAEKFCLTLSDVHLQPLVAEVIRLGEYDREAEIINNVPSHVLLTADRDCLYTVLASLITNAIQFNNPPKKVEIDYRCEDGFHAISVKDNGIGIHPSALHAIFEPFHLADADKLSRQCNRMGLALSIANKYLQLHGGNIGVESTVGEGSIFTVRIPLEVPYGF